MTEGQPLLEIDFLNETQVKIDQPDLTNHLNSILQRLGGTDRLKIELVFVEDKKIKALNHQFRQANQVTDVLSFPSPNPELIGSVVLSVDQAQKQAREAKIETNLEMKMLASHGLLHLLGYHHT